MRINSMNSVSQIYQANQMARCNKTKNTNSADSLEISSKAKDFQTALQAAKASEDVRSKKVEEIKKQMEEGTYQVSNKEVADKLVERFFEKLF